MTNTFDTKIILRNYVIVKDLARMFSVEIICSSQYRGLSRFKFTESLRKV